ncbi:glutaredoxin family protein [Bacillus pinisoli]|uniref:glutaredoxin family protein n=1 Tax=Bacillus pinisoli TaxID=2901866 RepID=UPI001FF45C95|nr:glutaredoxin [Bacillus pinisoli]
MEYVLFTMNGCLKCLEAKKLLNEYRYSYIEKNILLDVDARIELLKHVNELVAPVLLNLKNNQVLLWHELKNQKTICE